MHKWTEGEPLHSSSLPNLNTYQPHPLNPRCRLTTLQSCDESELVAEEGDQEQLTDSGIVTSDNHDAPPSCPSPLQVSLPIPIPCPRPSTLVLRPHSCPTHRRSSLPSNSTPSTSSSTALGLSFGLGAVFGCALYSFISGK